MRRNIIIMFTIVFSIFLHNIAEAKHIKPKKLSNREAYLVVDQKTGTILFSKYGNEKRHPASLTKMMTLYQVFEAIHQKKLTMNQKIKASRFASSQPSSKLDLRPGEELTVKEAVLSLIVKSANDSAVVLAEAVAGSESKFATKMNNTAKKIGMKNTNFVNASGLHNRNQYSTALDMAKLSIALKRDFPQYYNLFSKLEFEYKGQTIKTHNHVTRLYPGAKGMKTGYINASGFNLVTAAERGNKHLIGVVLGGKTSKERDKMMISMLDKHFASSRTLSPTLANKNVKSNNIAKSGITNKLPDRIKENIIQVDTTSVKKIDELATIIEKVQKEENIVQVNTSSVKQIDELTTIISKVQEEENPNLTATKTEPRLTTSNLRSDKITKIPTPYLKSQLNRNNKNILRQASVNK